jgi:hypothetical protein
MFWGPPTWFIPLPEDGMPLLEGDIEASLAALKSMLP